MSFNFFFSFKPYALLYYDTFCGYYNIGVEIFINFIMINFYQEIWLIIFNGVFLFKHMFYIHET